MRALLRYNQLYALQLLNPCASFWLPMIDWCKSWDFIEDRATIYYQKIRSSNHQLIDLVWLSTFNKIISVVRKSYNSYLHNSKKRNRGSWLLAQQNPFSSLHVQIVWIIPLCLVLPFVLVWFASPYVPAWFSPPSPRTISWPVIHGWSAQKYWYVPGCSNVTVNELTRGNVACGIASSSSGVVRTSVVVVVLPAAVVSSVAGAPGAISSVPAAGPWLMMWRSRYFLSLKWSMIPCI